jgi:hypothetical protein
LVTVSPHKKRSFLPTFRCPRTDRRGKERAYAEASELLRKATQLVPLVTVAADGAVHVAKQSAEAVELSTGGRVISLPA